MPNFQDKVVIVTGAGSGIGRATAEGFVRQGAKVVSLGRRLDVLREAAKGLPQGRILPIACDISNRSDVARAIAQALAQFGPTDILVNNAGINVSPRTVADVSFEDWQRVIDVNLTGTFNMVRGVLAQMRKKQDGVIINIASVAGLRMVAGTPYAASKHGVIALTNAINLEEWQNGIRCCAICPGEVNTPIMANRPVNVSSEEKSRMLWPEDIANTVAFVAGLPARASVPLVVIKPIYEEYN